MGKHLDTTTLQRMHRRPLRSCAAQPPPQRPAMILPRSCLPEPCCLAPASSSSGIATTRRETFRVALGSAEQGAHTQQGGELAGHVACHSRSHLPVLQPVGKEAVLHLLGCRGAMAGGARGVHTTRVECRSDARVRPGSGSPRDTGTALAWLAECDVRGLLTGICSRHVHLRSGLSRVV